MQIGLFYLGVVCLALHPVLLHGVMLTTKL